MKKLMMPQEQVFWTIQSDIKPQKVTGTVKTDVVIVGGGMAGMSAAQSFAKRGFKVVLVERYFCGAGASGKSSGFITPNAELGLTHYVDVYGPAKAKMVWDFVTSGVNAIRHNIESNALDCDYTKAPTLVVANSRSGFKEITTEYENLQKLHYESHRYDKQQLGNVLTSDSYFGGISFNSTFGINVFLYLQGMKKVLSDEGVKIYEETPAIAIHADGVETPEGYIKADQIILCIDKYLPELGLLPDKIYQVETFVMVSAPLSDAMVRSLFPDKRYMVWDTDMVYQYYRLTGDNRFMIGGSTLFRSFHLQTPYSPHSVVKKLTRYVAQKFPQLSLTFEYMWPGFIGVSKDLQALAGRDACYPHIYYISGATGLPWATALGSYAADAVIDNRTDMDQFFSPYRSFYFDGFMQKIMGKANAFSLANLLSLKK